MNTKNEESLQKMQLEKHSFDLPFECCSTRRHLVGAATMLSHGY